MTGPIQGGSASKTAFRLIDLLLRKTRSFSRVTTWRVSLEARAKGNWLQLQREKIQLMISHEKAAFALWKWYGRTGNNIQQLIVVIAHAEAFGGSFQLDEDFISIGPLRGIVDAFKLDFATSPDRAPKHLPSRAFFHYTEYSSTPRPSS
jgi:hypothetical protein